MKGAVIYEKTDNRRTAALGRKKESLWMLPGYMDGIAEAIYLPDKKIVWAVQWHPEFSYLTDDDSMKIFNKFIESCEA